MDDTSVYTPPFIYHSIAARDLANTGLNGKIISLDLSSANAIYKDDHNDVTPYNYNVNLFIKV